MSSMAICAHGQCSCVCLQLYHQKKMTITIKGVWGVLPKWPFSSLDGRWTSVTLHVCVCVEDQGLINLHSSARTCSYMEQSNLCWTMNMVIMDMKYTDGKLYDKMKVLSTCWTPTWHLWSWDVHVVPKEKWQFSNDRAQFLHLQRSSSSQPRQYAETEVYRI